MKIELVAIGNSRGIRIPKALIEQCGLGRTVDLRIEKDRLVISPDRAPREGWKEAFAAAGSSADECLQTNSMPRNGPGEPSETR